MTAILTKYQGFEIVRINRSQIELAYYNPRRISQGNKERLSKGLSKHLLVVPLTWNRTTGRLVSGHQRLQILDERHKGQDYLLDVAAIEVTEKEEAELNILLNNESAMGEFDTQAVKALTDEFQIDLGNCGFSREDLYMDFDLDKDLAPEKSPEEKQKIKERRDIEKQEYREQKAQGLTNDSEAKQDYTLSIVFPTNKHAHDFLDSYGFDPHKKTIPHDLFLQALGLLKP